MGTILFVITEALFVLGLGVHEAAQGYLADWRMPAMCGASTDLSSIFSPERVASWRRTNTHVKMTGGEALGVYQIFECFLTEVIAPQVPRSRLAYRALRILCDMLRETVFGTITEDQLAEAVAAFYSAVRNTSWGQFLHVQFHWLVHLPAEMKRFWLVARLLGTRAET